MTKSADQEQASPSSSLPAYVFEGPAQVAIRTRTNDQPRYVDTRLPVWTWYDGGLAMKIDWTALLSLQVLAYPATQLVEKFPSYAENAQRRALLTDHAVQWIEHTLAASLSSLNLLDPWYSPRRSRNLHGLPP